MKTQKFEKHYDGSEEPQNMLMVNSEHECVLFYGHGSDETGSYRWRKDYDHRPTMAEIRADIEALVNGITDERILSGFVWRGRPVWLSSETQFNIKCSYDLAVQTGGVNLPMKSKLGEDAEGNPIYYEFEDIETFQDFYMSAMGWIQQCIADGWIEKDGIDYTVYENV
jgi:hypothetical protein